MRTRKISENRKKAHELFYNILTFLPKKFRSVGLMKKENRGEKKFKAFNKIISFTFFVRKDSNLTISSNLSSRIF
jgi:hypothetical protein